MAGPGELRMCCATTAGPQAASIAFGPVSRTRWSPLAVLLLVALTGCFPSEQDSSSAAKQSSERDRSATSTTGSGDGELRFGRCTDQLASLAGLDCATLAVPIDPERPDGDTLDLAVARYPSTGDADERIGSLVLNPGGPGGSGIEYLTNAASLFPTSLTDRFDLVSFDPRGVAASTPVHCVDDEVKEESLTGDLTPDDDEELQRAVDEQREFREGCESRSGAMIEHMSTADVAADLDLLRGALGDEQLSYIGFSYGTSIGAVYATLFPERVRALVLDGSVSPTAEEEAQLIAQAQGFDRTFANFVAACNADDQCAIGPDAAASIGSTRSRLESAPVVVATGSDSRELGADLFDLAIATALYDTSLWGTLASSIAEIDDGGAAALLTLVDRQTGRKPDGSFDNSSDSQAMVSCADSPERLTVQEATDSSERIAASATTFGGLTAFGTFTCLDWPIAANPLPTITAAGSAPVLVVGTVGDPATPYEWSEQMAAALDGSVLLTYEGDGHTAFLRGGSCIEEAVVDYLVDLVLPAPGTRCPAQSEEASFTPLRDEIVDQMEAAGLPASVATCVVDGIIDDLGEAAFNELILSGDQEKLARLVTAQAMRCATAGD